MLVVASANGQVGIMKTYVEAPRTRVPTGKEGWTARNKATSIILPFGGTANARSYS
jgi:hypothetical protein